MEEQQSNAAGRRRLLRGLMGLPVLGGVLLGALAEARRQQERKDQLMSSLNIKAQRPPAPPELSGAPMRVGIIGFGSRGQQLARLLGYATLSWKKRVQKERPQALRNFLAQEDLNVRLTGVCDVFDVPAEEATQSFPGCKRYRHHEDMIASSDIDAVIIATPDHWHAPIAIKALQAGKHVYLEKPMAHNIRETYELREAARHSSAVFQLGHQHRQTQSFLTAQHIIQEKVLGHISLVQANTNRNSPNGAWQYPIHPKASPRTIDWEQFLGSAPSIPFNKEHFFRWRKWWAYGSGLSGDLMTHDFDRINCVLKMGIPRSATASGGIYTHRDGREVPDVLQVSMEYPAFSTGAEAAANQRKGMTFLYSATLGNQFSRKTLLMGHDGTMELGNALVVYADSNSTRYQEQIASGQIDPSVPMYAYNPAAEEVDGITSATSQYFADKGLLWTYRGGKRVDSSLLHLKEWLAAIRHGTPVSCGVEEGFAEAMSAHMASLSWKLGRRMDWDAKNEEIVAKPSENLDEILLAGRKNAFSMG